MWDDLLKYLRHPHWRAAPLAPGDLRCGQSRRAYRHCTPYRSIGAGWISIAEKCRWTISRPNCLIRGSRIRADFRPALQPGGLAALSAAIRPLGKRSQAGFGGRGRPDHRRLSVRSEIADHPVPRVRSPLGVICTLGNHDYSMYGKKNLSEGERRADYLAGASRDRQRSRQQRFGAAPARPPDRFRRDQRPVAPDRRPR